MKSPFPVFDFSGGINTRFASTSLEPNEFEDSENFHLEARGGLEKRNGYIKYIEDDVATGDPIVGLFQHRSVDGNKLLRVEGGVISYDNAGVWTDITDTLTIDDDKNSRISFETFLDYTVATNGINIPWKWDGSGVAELINQDIDGDPLVQLTKAGFIVKHAGLMVYGDLTVDDNSVVTRYASRIIAADAGTLDDFTWTGNTTRIDIDQGDGDNITHMVDALGYLVIFKNHSLHRVSNYGEATTQHTVRVANVGTPGRHTAKLVGQIIFFLDSVGRLWAYDVRGTNEDALVDLTSNKLGYTTLSQFIKARLPYAHLYHHRTRNEIWPFLSQITTETDAVWPFNLTVASFTRNKYATNFNVTAEIIDDDGQPQIVGGDFDGNVFLLDQGNTDDGVPITAFVKTRQFDLDALNLIKGFTDVDVYATVSVSQELTLEHFIDTFTSGDIYTLTIDPA